MHFSSCFSHDYIGKPARERRESVCDTTRCILSCGGVLGPGLWSVGLAGWLAGWLSGRISKKTGYGLFCFVVFVREGEGYNISHAQIQPKKYPVSKLVVKSSRCIMQIRREAHPSKCVRITSMCDLPTPSTTTTPRRVHKRQQVGRWNVNPRPSSSSNF